MTEITYIVNQPVKLSDHFTVPIDNSLWDGNTYNKTKKPWHPLRNRTIKFDDLLIPKTDYSLKHCAFGLYLMFFNDFKKYYVGIACKLANDPPMLYQLGLIEVINILKDKGYLDAIVNQVYATSFAPNQDAFINELKDKSKMKPLSLIAFEEVQSINYDNAYIMQRILSKNV